MKKLLIVFSAILLVAGCVMMAGCVSENPASNTPADTQTQTDTNEISTAEPQYKDKFIIIYYLPGNATSQSFVQITEKQGRKEKVLLNIERYNSLDTAYIKKDTIFKTNASQLLREFVIATINPDMFFVTSFVEGYFDDVVISIDKIFPAERTAIILYDLIPLVQKEKYLIDKNITEHYMTSILGLSKASLLLSISEYSKSEAEEMLDISKKKVINISSGVDKKFRSFKVSEIDKIALYKKYDIKNKFIMYTSSYDISKNQQNLI